VHNVDSPTPFTGLAETIGKYLLSWSWHIFMRYVDSLPAGLIDLTAIANTAALKLMLKNYL